MIELDGNRLSLDQASRVTFGGEGVALAEAARLRVCTAAQVIENLIAENIPVYGINTGFGYLSTQSIARDDLEKLQENIILSHAMGLGEPAPEEIVRAMLLFRINSLAKGKSGIRGTTIDYLIDLLNKHVHPIVPMQGSVGSSGDLAPLAHMALVLLGKGQAIHKAERISGKRALEIIGRDPVCLAPKEGLALLNGTQFMSSLSFLVYVRGKLLLDNAVAAAALALEALRGFSDPFKAILHTNRPHPGQVLIARQMRELIKGSSLVDSTKEDVQDAYSLRCIPQVLGPAVEALSFLKTKLEIEINSATDNPLLFADGSVLSGGNFHGQILGLALEMAGMAMAEVGNIAERQIDRLLTSTNRGLPLFLIKEQGLNSGLMLSQYTAAALVSENKVLCHPALTDSIPTSAGKEDHNSLAPISGRKALRILDNLEKIIAIEYLCAAQAIDFQDKGKLAPATRAIYDRIRKLVCHTDRDTYMAPKIEQLASAVHTGKLINGKL
jgi:histidine ammonia-lyase